MIAGVEERERERVFVIMQLSSFMAVHQPVILETVRLRLWQQQLWFKISMRHKCLISLQVTQGKRAHIFHVFHVFFSLLLTSLYTVNNHVLKDNVICFSHKKNMQTDHKIYVNSHYAAKQ
jgi:hypothetical protein